MPGLTASGPTPAIVAYARVNIDGTSPDMNSGVTTRNSATGIVLIDLPSNLAQPIGRDLVMLTIRRDSGSAPNNAFSINYRWLSETQIQVDSWVAAGEINTHANVAFDFILFRSTISPPFGAPS